MRRPRISGGLNIGGKKRRLNCVTPCAYLFAGMIRAICHTCLSESDRRGGMRLQLTWKTAAPKKVRLRYRASRGTFVIYVARAGLATAAARPMEASRQRQVLREAGAAQHLWSSDALYHVAYTEEHCWVRVCLHAHACLCHFVPECTPERVFHACVSCGSLWREWL